ncbi:hypothetical protein [Halobacterium sp. R2-5]|nr:hypothetical protein [Halobacterium sp. R2-5]NIB99858.1 hypothetical protein [Halobacterium sp. R2-5]
MLKHATTIDATVGHSSRISVSTPDEDEDEEEQRATGFARLLAWRRRLGF